MKSRRVARRFDIEQLRDICLRDELDFDLPRTDLPPMKWRIYKDEPRFYYYRNTGAPVLAVAHLDTVCQPSFSHMETDEGPLVVSGALDDRLGAYIILDLLPKMGIEVDVLLTTGEESGNSTAQDFMLEHGDKQYNWIFSFDRAGSDVVMYQYHTEWYADLLKERHARVGIGSYSDIVDLDDLGVAGFNWGCGYQNNHSKRSSVWLNDTFVMVAKFSNFYAKHKNTLLPHEPKPYIQRSWAFNDLDYYDSLEELSKPDIDGLWWDENCSGYRYGNQPIRLAERAVNP